MGHRWEDYKTPGSGYFAPPERRCLCCGAVQHEVLEYAWMRIVGRKWRPLAPKCEAPGINPRHRHLYTRQAETKEGRETVERAIELSHRMENRGLTDGQLLRLAYWGRPGDA